MSAHKETTWIFDIRKLRPVCPDFISSYITAIAASDLEKLFNKVIAILTKHNFFPKKVHALLDASEIESTEQCPGCGKVKKEKAPELRRRKRRIRKVYEIVLVSKYGRFGTQTAAFL